MVPNILQSSKPTSPQPPLHDPKPGCSLHSNELPEFPPELGRLSECVRLSLYQNRLTSLPPEIGQLTALQVGAGGVGRRGGARGVAAPPRSLRKALASIQLALRASCPHYSHTVSSLAQELWLYSNQLTCVPRELAQLTGLKRLWLDRNQLVSVPAELAQLTNLQMGEDRCQLRAVAFPEASV